MIVLRLVRWIWGYVVFTAQGLFPERFMNLTARSGINMWDVKGKGKCLHACVMKSEYKNLRPMAKKSKMKLKVQKRRGLPFFFRRFQKRAGLLVGAALFVGILYFLSMYVWSVQVNGCEAISEEQVKQVLSELGLNPGTLKKEIDGDRIAQSAMIRLPEVGWLAVNVRGSAVTVELRERTKPPEMVPVDEPCNLVAEMDGQVVRTEVKDGSAEVMVGDAVVKGQLLVSGVVEDKYGNNVLKHAAGRIIAATKRTLVAEVPLSQTVLRATENVIIRKRMCIFGLEIPINLTESPGENYAREISIDDVKAGDVTLPITFYTEKWTEQKPVPLELNEQQAKEQAMKSIKEQERNELGDVTVTDRQENGYVKNGIYYLEATYSCEEDIAQEKQLMVTDLETGDETAAK